jgi:hypothetical protein
LPTRHTSPRTGLTLPPRWCHRRQARAMFTLIGRAPDVPYASVDSGHSRTTRVSECPLRAVGSLHTRRSEGASQARGAPGDDRPCRARPADRPWSRSTGAPEASATKRDRTLGLHWVRGPPTTEARAVTNGHHRRREVAGRPASSSGSSHDASGRIGLWSRRSRGWKSATPTWPR